MTTMIYFLQVSGRLLLLTTLFLVMVIPFSFSQSLKYKKPKKFIGMEGGFGARSFTIESNIPQLDELTTIKGGGRFGFIYGTPLVKFPCVVGLYFMSIQEKRTIDLFTFQTGANISLLHLIGIRNSRFDIYALSGLGFEKFTFMGTYLKEIPNDMQRRAISGEPHLGSVNILNANVGVGIEIRLMEGFDFVHLFIESKKIIPIASGATVYFDKTSITNNPAINVGFRVGRIR